MTSLTRFLHRTVARRAYSSFFSSKAGGGRYFNPAKPPKAQAVPRNNAAKKTNTVDRPATALSSNPDAIDGLSGANTSPKGASSSQALPGTELENSANLSTTTPTVDSLRSLLLDPLPSAHPVIGDKDLKVQQFFSLHRPLLLLSNPSSIFHSSPTTSIFSLADPNASASPPPPPPAKYSLESAAESDAEAARQLARAIAVNHAGAAFAWEETLRRLGLDVNLEVDRVGLQQQLDKEYRDVMMDSVKRKRRKKMKKHKLKKRRRATRSQRLKMR